MNDSKIIVALDYDNMDSVKGIVKQLDASQCRLKIGKELFTACGPSVVDFVQNAGFDVFLDLKFHDIPVTTAKACKAAANMNVWMVNVHALGGKAMLEAAKNAVLSSNSTNQTKLIAVTMLTSLDNESYAQLGFSRTLDEQVSFLAHSALNAGLDGVVCSAKETASLRQEIERDFIFVTPGIRPSGTDLNDQKRAVTPSEAIQNGSDYLVIGRPITQSPDPKSALAAIFSSINE